METMRRGILCFGLALCFTAAAADAQTVEFGGSIGVSCKGSDGSFCNDTHMEPLIAFHPGARGRAMVEKFQAAAEQYGYIVAGSNNSRNGPWPVSAAAVEAMSNDLGQRLIPATNRPSAVGSGVCCAESRSGPRVACRTGITARCSISTGCAADSSPTTSAPARAAVR